MVGLFGFACAAALPAVLWHDATAEIATDFRIEPGYRNAYMGWGTPLYVLGLALASQVAAAVS